MTNMDGGDIALETIKIIIYSIIFYILFFESDMRDFWYFITILHPQIYFLLCGIIGTAYLIIKYGGKRG